MKENKIESKFLRTVLSRNFEIAFPSRDEECSDANGGEKVSEIHESIGDETRRRFKIPIIFKINNQICILSIPVSSPFIRPRIYQVLIEKDTETSYYPLHVSPFDYSQWMTNLTYLWEFLSLSLLIISFLPVSLFLFFFNLSIFDSLERLVGILKACKIEEILCSHPFVSRKARCDATRRDASTNPNAK